MKTILTLVCDADRRKHECMVDSYEGKRLLNVKHWVEICLSCDHHRLKLTQRGDEINEKYKAPEVNDGYRRL